MPNIENIVTIKFSKNVILLKLPTKILYLNLIEHLCKKFKKKLIFRSQNYKKPAYFFDAISRE